jgi:hypothetical protein
VNQHEDPHDHLHLKRRDLATKFRRPGDREVIEEALRRYLGLDLLERLWAKNDLGEDEAVALPLEAQRATRANKH